MELGFQQKRARIVQLQKLPPSGMKEKKTETQIFVCLIQMRIIEM